MRRDYGEAGWTTITMRNLGASSRGEHSPRKTILDLPSNPRLEDGERYVRRIISKKIVKPAAIQSVLKLAWASYGKCRISEIEDIIMLFEFENIIDKDQIFDMSSWVIQGHCLSL